MPSLFHPPFFPLPPFPLPFPLFFSPSFFLLLADGNVSYWDEYEADVGHALSEPILDAGSGIWARNFSGALVLLNPAVTGSAAASYELPQGYAYTDLWGASVPAGPLIINATRGAVLLRAPAPAALED